jgi:DNA-binding NarL/FixJ family response regulator
VAGEDSQANGPIRVLLADDHTMFRQGIAGILADYGAMEVVAEVPNDQDALALARELRPDAVVMQVQVPFERALGTLSAMRSFPDPPRVVIVTMLERCSAGALASTPHPGPAPRSNFGCQ